MATALITATSSAPTLRELAAAAADEARIEAARRKQGIREQNAAILVARIMASLGIFADVDRVVLDENDQAFVTIEGMMFGLERDDNDMPYLTVATSCSHECGQPVWVPVDAGSESLSLLHAAITRPHEHPFGCPNDARMPAPAPETVIPGTRARDAIAAIEAAGERLAHAVRAVQELEDGRAAQKSAAIKRLMQTTNEETQKPHSASSADKVVELDAEYSAYRRSQADAEVAKHRGWALFEAAKRTADLELEIYRALERNR